MLSQLQEDMALLYMLESHALTAQVHTIQSALWSSALARGAGASHTLIAAYALEHHQTVVTCDRDFVHISRAIKKAQTNQRLYVLAITGDMAPITSA